jgi:hypothetical protein
MLFRTLASRIVQGVQQLQNTYKFLSQTFIIDGEDLVAKIGQEFGEIQRLLATYLI